jgi:signal peptidase I
MLPTIQIGDHLFVNKLAYAMQLPFVGVEVARWGHVDRGDIIVFTSPADGRTDLIKRVVAVGGDKVEIRQKRLYINDMPVADPYARFTDPMTRAQQTRDNFGPVTVPPGKIFVLGDNRDQSYDSRYWGFAGEEAVKGKATFIYWSRNSRVDWMPRWERFGHYLR